MHLRRPSHLTVFLIVFLAGFGDGAFFRELHEFLVRHSYCPTHGELIHSDSTTDTTIQTHKHTIGKKANSVSANETAKSIPHHHEHCSVSVSKPFAPHQPLTPQITEFRFQQQTRLVVRAYRRQYSLLLQAPKTSPPSSHVT